MTTYGKLEICSPEGGSGGAAFDDIGEIVTAIAAAGRVAEVRVWHAGFIDAIQFVYLIGGVRVEAPKHGGEGGKLDSFTLQPGEYITHVQGRAAGFIDHLRFFTNKGTSLHDTLSLRIE